MDINAIYFCPLIQLEKKLGLSLQYNLSLRKTLKKLPVTKDGIQFIQSKCFYNKSVLYQVFC